jgi:hypothetical protein
LLEGNEDKHEYLLEVSVGRLEYLLDDSEDIQDLSRAKKYTWNSTLKLTRLQNWFSVLPKEHSVYF